MDIWASKSLLHVRTSSLHLTVATIGSSSQWCAGMMYLYSKCLAKCFSWHQHLPEELRHCTLLQEEDRTGQGRGGEKRGRKCQSWAVSTLQTGKRWEASRNSHVVHCPAIQCTTKASLTYIHSKYAFTKFLQAFIYKTGWTANHRGSRGCRVLGAAIRPQCRQHCEQEWENVNSYNLRELQSQPNAD